MIEKTKSEKWEAFVQEAVTDNPWSLPYKLAGDKINVSKVASNIQTENGYTMSWHETAETVIKDLFPQDEEENDTLEQQHIRRENIEYLRTATGRLGQFTEDQLGEVMWKMKEEKAPEIDAIDLKVNF